MSDPKSGRLLPSSTVLMVRDGAAGLEVFMVKRNHAIDFASGAMVFPGGKLAEGDSDPVLMGRHTRPGRFDPALTPFWPWSRRSEEHTSELQSLMRISYAVFCLKKKTSQQIHINNTHKT